MLERCARQDAVCLEGAPAGDSCELYTSVHAGGIFIMGKFLC